MENLISAVVTAIIMTDYKTKIDEAKALFPFLVLLDNDQRHDLRKASGKLTGYVDAVYAGLQSHEDAIPSATFLTEFTKDVELLPKIREAISYVNTNLLEPLESTLIQLTHELASDADYGYGVLKLEGKSGNTAVIETLALIAAQTKGMGTRPDVLSVDVPAAGSVTVNNTIPGSKLIVTGDSILQLDSGPEIVGSVKVAAIRINPGSSEPLPAGYTQITVTNISSDKAGKFLVKVKGI